MAAGDAQRWDAIYRRRTAVQPASCFVRNAAHWLPSSGTVLDVAGGSGRHGLWMARRGLDVTVVDVSAVALERVAAASSERGLSVATLARDLEASGLPEGRWNVIVCSHFLQRSLFASFREQLEFGGVLLFCQPTARNLERHASPSRRFLLSIGEALALVESAGLEIMHYEEGWCSTGRHEARVVARQRAVSGQCATQAQS